VCIYNVSGQLIKQVHKEISGSLRVSTGELKSGLYLLVVNDGDHVSTKRFIKE
jgi:hypothetical protein